MGTPMWLGAGVTSDVMRSIIGGDVRKSIDRLKRSTGLRSPLGTPEITDVAGTREGETGGLEQFWGIIRSERAAPLPNLSEKDIALLGWNPLEVMKVDTPFYALYGGDYHLTMQDVLSRQKDRIYELGGQAGQDRVDELYRDLVFRRLVPNDIGMRGVISGGLPIPRWRGADELYPNYKSPFTGKRIQFEAEDYQPVGAVVGSNRGGKYDGNVFTIDSTPPAAFGAEARRVHDVMHTMPGRPVIQLDAPGISEQEMNRLRESLKGQGMAVVSAKDYAKLVPKKQLDVARYRMSWEELRNLANEDIEEGLFEVPEKEKDRTEVLKDQYQRAYVNVVGDIARRQAEFNNEKEQLGLLYRQRQKLKEQRESLEEAISEYNTLKEAAVSPQAIGEYRSKVLNAVRRVAENVSQYQGKSQDEMASMVEQFEKARYTPAELQSVYNRTIQDLRYQEDEVDRQIADAQARLRQLSTEFASKDAVTDTKLQYYSDRLGVPYKAPRNVSEYASRYQIPDFVEKSQEAIRQPTREEKKQFLKDKIESAALTEFRASLKMFKDELVRQREMTKALTDRLREPPTKRMDQYIPVPVYQPMQHMYHRFQETPFGYTYGYRRGRDYSGIVPRYYAEGGGLRKRYRRSNSRVRSGSRHGAIGGK